MVRDFTNHQIDGKNVKKFISFLKQNFLAEFKAVGEATTYPTRINFSNLKKELEYEILKVEYVATKVHAKSVVVRIYDDEGKERGLFLPEKYADKFRKNFENPEDINCYQLFLQFNGFQDEAKQLNPILEIVYKGEAQPI